MQKCQVYTLVFINCSYPSKQHSAWETEVPLVPLSSHNLAPKPILCNSCPDFCQNSCACIHSLIKADDSLAVILEYPWTFLTDAPAIARMFKRQFILFGVAVIADCCVVTIIQNLPSRNWFIVLILVSRPLHRWRSCLPWWFSLLWELPFRLQLIGNKKAFGQRWDHHILQRI